MAVNDIKVISGGQGVKQFRTDDRDTSSETATLKPGDVVKRGGAGNNFATVALTGDPEVGTDILLGVVYSESTETASADGVVNVELISGDTVLRGKAATATNMDTDAELLLLLNDYVAFDRSAANSGGTLTIDEDEGDDPNVHGLNILDGDIVKGTLDVAVHQMATFHGSTV